MSELDIAPGSIVLVRDLEWQVTEVERFAMGTRTMVRCVGRSELVRDQEAVFFSDLEEDFGGIRPVDPKLTTFRLDESANARQGRLYIEALLRRTPRPATDTVMRTLDSALVDDLPYQRKPWQQVASQLQARLLIADATGLGKTIEVGLILSELQRRGRANRILAVVPRHILDQVQHELWTRFGIPLIRLDSDGIRRIKQQIPPNRNPFTFYNRAIVSIDTLKNPHKYRPYLENLSWDVVWIDESHKCVNPGTLNAGLADVLAETSDTFLLSSATPHNGKPESFGRLIRLVDPTAVVDPVELERDDIEHLFVRRHKHSPDVEQVVGDRWAARKDPLPVDVTPSASEEAVFRELSRTWIGPEVTPPSGDDRLFPYTLLKAALSSPVALRESVEARIERAATSDAERIHLKGLHALADEAVQGSAKLDALASTLDGIGVGHSKPTRVVVFSERIATLEWISAELRERLQMDDDEVVIFHNSLSDVEQSRVVEQFSMPSAPVRVLVTSDIASEGVNLHRECHQLVHFDLPWSLITLEQRNGRIDRYGQTVPPQIRFLSYLPDDDEIASDVAIVRRLAEKEHKAHLALGDVGDVMGLHDPDAETHEIMEVLRDRASNRQEALDALVPAETTAFDPLAFLMDRAPTTSNEEVDFAKAEPDSSLFGDRSTFVHEAMLTAFDDPAEQIDYEHNGDSFVFSPPEDLQRRLRVLPRSYLRQHSVLDRVRMTTDARTAEMALEQARTDADGATAWPAIQYAGANHPILEWLIDRILYAFPRGTAPLVGCAVEEPVVLVQGLWANRGGQPLAVRWLAATDLHRDVISFADMFDVLERAHVKPGMVNRGTSRAPEWFTDKLDKVVEAAKAEMADERDDWQDDIDRRIDRHRARLDAWTDRARQAQGNTRSPVRARQWDKAIEQTRRTTTSLLEANTPADAPLLRIVAALDPARGVA